MKLKFLIPLSLFLVLLVLLAVGLRLDPREVPSPLVNKTAPDFRLAQLEDTERVFTPQDMKGRVWLLNVWASWCAPCQLEHPVLMDLAKTGVAPIVGLSYKDQRQDALKVLRRSGNPYAVSVSDPDGRVGIEYGVYGVPETYVIDQAGVIRHKHIGPLSPEALQGTLLPLLRELKKS